MLLDPLCGQQGNGEEWGPAPYEEGEAGGAWPLVVDFVRPSCYRAAGPGGNWRNPYRVCLVDSPPCLGGVDSYEELSGSGFNVIWREGIIRVVSDPCVEQVALAGCCVW